MSVVNNNVGSKYIDVSVNNVDKLYQGVKNLKGKLPLKAQREIDKLLNTVDVTKTNAQEAITKAKDIVKNKVETVWDKIKSFLGKFGKVGQILGAAALTLGVIAFALGSLGVGALAALPLGTIFAYGGIGIGVGSAFIALKSIASGIDKKINGNNEQNIVGTVISDFFSETISNINTGLTGGINVIGDLISGKLKAGDLKNIAAKVVSSAKADILSIKDDVLEGKDALNNVFKGVKGNVNKLKDEFLNIALSIKQLSVASDYGDIDNQTFIEKMLKNGDAFDKIKDSLPNHPLVKTIKGAIENVREQVKSNDLLNSTFLKDIFTDDKTGKTETNIKKNGNVHGNNSLDDSSIENSINNNAIEDEDSAIIEDSAIEDRPIDLKKNRVKIKHANNTLMNDTIDLDDSFRIKRNHIDNNSIENSLDFDELLEDNDNRKHTNNNHNKFFNDDDILSPYDIS